MSARRIDAPRTAAILESVSTNEPTAIVDTDGWASEHRTLVEGCGLVDRSERGKLALTGSGAIEFLDGQITNELGGLRPGQGCYAAFLTHKGKMLGDLRILAVGDEDADVASELLLDTERVALQGLFDLLRRFKVGYDVELHKRTLDRALLSLIGPEAERVAAAEGLGHLEHASRPVEIARVDALASLTDVSVDLVCPAADGERVSAALQERG